MDSSRPVLIRYIRDGSTRRASGLRVGGRFVLTADHCANGTEHRLMVGGREYQATVYVRSNTEAVDVAVLIAEDLPELEPLRGALINRAVIQDIECQALGFPSWKRSPSGAGTPVLVQTRGRVPTAEGVDPFDRTVALLSFKITDPEIPSAVPSGEMDQATSPWAGMAGSGVVTSDDQLVGVIRSHNLSEGGRSLTVTPLDAISTLPSPTAGMFWAALGVNDPASLPRLPLIPTVGAAPTMDAAGERIEAKRGADDPAALPRLPLTPESPTGAITDEGEELIEAERVIGYAADLVSDRRPVGADDDLLDIEDDVRTLSRLLLARSTHPPLAIGLFGSWGSGKSFFMQRLRTCILEMTDSAAKDSSTGSTYCEYVVPVNFNAWHYMDADLWAALTSHIYRSIAGVKGAGENLRAAWLDNLVSTAGKRNEAAIRAKAADRQLARLEPELKRRNEALERLRDPLDPGIALATAGGLLADAAGLVQGSSDKDLEALTEDAAFGRSVLAAAVTRSRRRLWVPLVVIAAVLVLVGVLYWTGQLSAVAAATSSLATIVVTATASVVNGVRTVRVKREQLQHMAERKSRELDAAMDALQAQRDQALADRDSAVRDLQSLQDVGHVGRYLSEKAQSAAYRDRLGLVSLIREDLEQLSRALDPTSPDSVDARIERIVLYIDDLDRCAPERVVEVLQAVHLLLAFPLFVVVVAVEHRWLLTCLEMHYRKMLGDDDDAVKHMKDWELTPADYLEKIFQIPLTLRPMSSDGFSRLVDSLVTVEPATAETVAAEPLLSTLTTEMQVAAATQDQTGGSTTSPIDPSAPLSVFEGSVAGELLLLLFDSTGRRLAVVTTNGVWLWERGRDLLTYLVEAPIVSASARTDGDVIATVGRDDAIRVIDLHLRRVRSETPENPDRRMVVPLTYQRLIGRDELQERFLAPASPDSIVGTRPVAAERPEAMFASPDLVTIQYPRAVATWKAEDDGSFTNMDTFNLADHESFFDNETFDRNRIAISSQGELLLVAGVNLCRGAGPSNQPMSITHWEVVSGDPGLNAARSSEGWWIRDSRAALGDTGGLALWRDQQEAPTESTHKVRRGQLCARQESPWVVSWGDHGFDVFDRSAVRFRVEGLAVAGVAVSPLGSIVATVSRARLNLWRVTGSRIAERADQLEFESDEVAFLKSLAPIVTTPRQAKRVVNLFRLIRASRRGRSMLADPVTGDYRVALTMLTLAVCSPGEASALFVSIETNTSEGDVSLRTGLPAAVWLPGGPLASVAQDAALGEAALSTCREWARIIQRYYIAPHDAPKRLANGLDE